MCACSANSCARGFGDIRSCSLVAVGVDFHSGLLSIPGTCLSKKISPPAGRRSSVFPKSYPAICLFLVPALRALSKVGSLRLIS